MQNIVGKIWMASQVPAIIAKSSKKVSFGKKAHRLQPISDSMNSTQIDKLIDCTHNQTGMVVNQRVCVFS